MHVYLLVAALACAALSSGCATAGTPAHSVPLQHGVIEGYLAPRALPDSLTLLPQPPAPASAALALDEEVHGKNLSTRGTPRWDLAKQDADMSFPAAADAFSCALDAPISQKDTPRMYRLLSKSFADAHHCTAKAKEHYQRTRPFAFHDETTCTPEADNALRKSGSYPSGHSTVGWVWALILGEIAPGRIDAILARGLAYGDSRLVCDAHWQSDVTAGRIMGASAVAALHADPAFLADLAAAKLEFAAARARGLKPQRDCAREAAVLGE